MTRPVSGSLPLNPLPSNGFSLESIPADSASHPSGETPTFPLAAANAPDSTAVDPALLRHLQPLGQPLGASAEAGSSGSKPTARPSRAPTLGGRGLRLGEKKALTPRQKEVFEFIKERIRQTNRPPTLREIGQRFEITSTNGVRSILSALSKKNYIVRSPKLSRGIDIPTPLQKPLLKESEERKHSDKLVEIPILGRVAAGQPLLAVENLEGTVVVDRDFLLRRQDVFALRVKGDSMRDAGILNGDLIFARHQNNAERGQVVVALIGEEATVKYYYPEGERIRLEPANETFRPIIVDRSFPEFSIVGRVIGVQRQYH